MAVVVRVASLLTVVLRCLSSRRRGAGLRLGTCPGCLTGVYEEDHHVRYRGEVFHVDPCVDISPYAMRGLRD